MRVSPLPPLKHCWSTGRLPTSSCRASPSLMLMPLPAQCWTGGAGAIAAWCVPLAPASCAATVSAQLHACTRVCLLRQQPVLLDALGSALNKSTAGLGMPPQPAAVHRTCMWPPSIMLPSAPLPHRPQAR